MKFLLDANFLMAVGQFKVDIFEQLGQWGRPELYTLDLVVRELENIRDRRGRDARNARLALALIEQKSIKVLKARAGVHADDELERHARMGYTVCTQDRALLGRLKGKGLEAVRIRQKRLLAKA